MSMREWMATHLTAEELTAWGASVVLAVASIIDNLETETPS